MGLSFTPAFPMWLGGIATDKQAPGMAWLPAFPKSGLLVPQEGAAKETGRALAPLTSDASRAIRAARRTDNARGEAACRTKTQTP